MFARDLMTADPFVVFPADPLTRAAEVMRDMDIGIVPVVDDARSMRLRGLITDRDIAVRCVAGHRFSGCTVADHMTGKPLHTVHPDDTIAKVLNEMDEGRVRRLLVVDDDNRLLGVIAQADVVRKLGPTEPDTVMEVIRHVSSPVPALA